jgi:hypothetical protein
MVENNTVRIANDWSKCVLLCWAKCTPSTYDTPKNKLVDYITEQIVQYWSTMYSIKLDRSNGVLGLQHRRIYW